MNILKQKNNKYLLIKYEVHIAVKIKNGVFWYDIM
jgi:hypothetical protein